LFGLGTYVAGTSNLDNKIKEEFLEEAIRCLCFWCVCSLEKSRGQECRVESTCVMFSMRRKHEFFEKMEKKFSWRGLEMVVCCCSKMILYGQKGPQKLWKFYHQPWDSFEGLKRKEI
jgi:hypothetical protein